MNRILVLFTHPLLEKSRVQKELLSAIQSIKGITINDLYEQYPDFNIDVPREKQLLLEHDVIVWQHPLYWYSAPALLKQWQDLVLEHGWAYGRTGKALKDKIVFNVISSGGGMQSYQHGGFQQYTIKELLLPFERTAMLCSMRYWPPFWVAGSHLLSVEKIQEYAQQYRKLLEQISEGFYSDADTSKARCLNDIVSLINKEA